MKFRSSLILVAGGVETQRVGGRVDVVASHAIMGCGADVRYGEIQRRHIRTSMVPFV